MVPKHNNHIQNHTDKQKTHRLKHTYTKEQILIAIATAIAITRAIAIPQATALAMTTTIAVIMAMAITGAIARAIAIPDRHTKHKPRNTKNTR